MPRSRHLDYGQRHRLPRNGPVPRGKTRSDLGATLIDQQAGYYTTDVIMILGRAHETDRVVWT